MVTTNSWLNISEGNDAWSLSESSVSFDSLRFSASPFLGVSEKLEKMKTLKTKMCFMEVKTIKVKFKFKDVRS